MSKVVILDSQSQDAAGLSEQLARAGSQVYQASCVLSALDLARSKTADLLVVADDQPVLGVTDLLELRRTDVRLQSVPVMVIASSGSLRPDCFKLGCDDFIELPCDDDEIAARAGVILRRSLKPGLHGTLSEVSLVDLVQMLVAAGKSGKCSVKSRTAAGEFFLSAGQIVHAAAQGLEGEEALLALLTGCREQGQFSFVGEDTRMLRRTIEKRTDHLLLELANTIDEQAVAP